MEQFHYTITDKLGIHARPAGLLVKEASKFNANVTLNVGEKNAAGNKLFAIMGLSAKQGDTITVRVEGPDEKDAAAALQTFFEQNI